jgi:hypothetical protein
MRFAPNAWREPLWRVTRRPRDIRSSALSSQKCSNGRLPRIAHRIDPPNRSRTRTICPSLLSDWQKRLISLQTYVLFQALPKVDRMDRLKSASKRLKEPELLSTNLRQPPNLNQGKYETKENTSDEEIVFAPGGCLTTIGVCQSYTNQQFGQSGYNRFLPGNNCGENRPRPHRDG